MGWVAEVAVCQRRPEVGVGTNPYLSQLGAQKMLCIEVLFLGCLWAANVIK